MKEIERQEIVNKIEKLYISSNRKIEEYGEIVCEEFNNFFKTNSDKCKHNIWLYEGSYAFVTDPLTGEHKYIKIIKENSDLHEYNKYICLECEKEINIRDWQQFEKNNLVLKNQSSQKSIIQYYRNYYFKLLNTEKTYKAQEELIREFYSDKKERKIKKLKK